MRAFCTVSAPLEVCASSAEQLSPGSRFLALRLLGNQQPKTLYFLVDAKSRVREVYTQTCLHFATQGMLDTELFGLAVLIDGEYMFADPESKLSKYGPKSWRSSHTHGLDANGRPLLELHFRVQFYIESPFMLKDETSRHNYYLQLKYNALQRDLPKDYSEQSMILLAGLALQADLGDAPTTPISMTATTTTTTTTTTSLITTASKHETSKRETTSPFNAVQDLELPIGVDSAVASGNKNSKNSSKLTATAVSAPTTTTLPKISKRNQISANEKVLRLSTYVASTSQAAATTSNTTATASSLSCVFPISGSLKRSFGVVAATLSPSSSLLSASRNADAAAAAIATATKLSASPSNASSSAASSASSHTDYFRLDEYLPEGLRTAWTISALRACHRENRGMSTSDAELHYIQHACVVHESINAHIFRMRMSKNGPGNTWFVVYAKGIKIFGVSDKPQQQITFLWPNITKLSFERKKFEIRSGESKITLYATSDEKNKMLLTLCKETHQFSMKIAARLKEVIKREEEESNCLHACYIYSRSLHLPYKNKNDQRISVISSTSSNTTSGIVSDRVHSEDELEIMINTPPAPIAAPSTESLALAHLLDRPSVSRQTSSAGQVSLKDLEEHLAALSVRQAQKKRSSNSRGESPAELSNVSAGNSSTSDSIPISSQRTADSSTTTDSPNSQHNIGSQCSSTCSTVVVASASASETNGNPLISLTGASSINSSATRRQDSTSSSLELGFSHTAQNSTLSEVESSCIDHDYTNSTRDETESVSGVYTLANTAPTETSGVYTMHSSEMTGQSSEIAESEKSSNYGIFQPTKSESGDSLLHTKHSNRDSVDGGNFHGKRIKNEEFRMRSDSNVSTSGSFRGDGSDPTDNKHTLLSAEELTDLIVGRGTYPNRKTVSSTLDSDCDYVTLPLPMEGESYIQGHQDTAPTEDHVEDLINDLLPTDPPAPPQRIDSNSLSHSNLASLSNIRMRSPPPYNARHEKTGLCGPPIRNSLQKKPVINTTHLPTTTAAKISNVPSPKLVMTTTTPTMTPKTKTTTMMETKKVTKAIITPPPPCPPAAVRRRDPPPYQASAKPRPTSLISVTTAASSQIHGTNALSTAGGSMNSLKSEEITARFITTRPQISILKAHTSVVNENPKPSYAAPTNCSSATSSTGSTSSHHIPNLSQQSLMNSNYGSSSQASLSLGHHHHHHHHHHPHATVTTQSSISAAAVAHAAAAAAAGAGVIPSTIGIPIVPYSLHGAHKSMSSLHQQPPPPPPPYSDMKPPPACVLLPVIKPRQFLPPPPPSLPRQPPPPPPPQLAGVYSSQLARKQLELYQQQLYSDVDYVIYPLQDPAVSQQEYLDAKQGSLLAAMAQNPPPHPYLAYHTTSAHGGWDTCKGHAIYRSTPYLPLAYSAHSRYASTQNLSDTYVQLPSAYSPLYSPSMASLCSSYEPPPPPPLHPAALAAAANTSNLFARSRSDDNILNSLDSLPKVKRLPPPPPPPYVNRRLKKPPMPAPTEKPPPIPSKPLSSLSTATFNSQPSMPHSTASLRCQLPPHKPLTLSTTRSANHMTKTSSGAQWAGERPRPDVNLGRGSSSILADLQASMAAANRKSNPNAMKLPTTLSTRTSATAAAAAANALDIALLREKSKHLDLPLISALCNDRSLLKQTKVLVNPKNTKNSANSTQTIATAAAAAAAAGTPTSTAASTEAATTLANYMQTTATAQTPATTTTTSTSTISNCYGKHGVSKSLVAVIGTNATNATATSTTATATTATTNGAITTTAAATLTTEKLLAAVTAVTTTATTATTTNTLNKQPRKTAVISHRHPNDKLPPLPMQLAEANNYVMDPAILKHHKSYTAPQT